MSKGWKITLLILGILALAGISYYYFVYYKGSTSGVSINPYTPHNYGGSGGGLGSPSGVGRTRLPVTCTDCVDDFQMNLKGASQTVTQTQGTSTFSTPMLNNAISQLINCASSK